MLKYSKSTIEHSMDKRLEERQRCIDGNYCTVVLLSMEDRKLFQTAKKLRIQPRKVATRDF